MPITAQLESMGGMLSKRLISLMRNAQLQLAVKFRFVTILFAALGTVTSAYLASSSQVVCKTRKLIVPHAVCEESFFYRVSIIDRLDSNRMIMIVIDPDRQTNRQTDGQGQ